MIFWNYITPYYFPSTKLRNILLYLSQIFQSRWTVGCWPWCLHPMCPGLYITKGHNLDYINTQDWKDFSWQKAWIYLCGKLTRCWCRWRIFLNQLSLAAKYEGNLKLQRKACHIWAPLSSRKCQDVMTYALRESEHLSPHFYKKGREHNH